MTREALLAIHRDGSDGVRVGDAQRAGVGDGVTVGRRVAGGDVGLAQAPHAVADASRHHDVGLVTGGGVEDHGLVLLAIAEKVDGEGAGTHGAADPGLLDAHDVDGHVDALRLVGLVRPGDDGLGGAVVVDHAVGEFALGVGGQRGGLAGGGRGVVGGLGQLDVKAQSVGDVLAKDKAGLAVLTLPEAQRGALGGGVHADLVVGRRERDLVALGVAGAHAHVAVRADKVNVVGQHVGHGDVGVLGALGDGLGDARKGLSEGLRRGGGVAPVGRAGGLLLEGAHALGDLLGRANGNGEERRVATLLGLGHGVIEVGLLVVPAGAGNHSLRVPAEEPVLHGLVPIRRLAIREEDDVLLGAVPCGKTVGRRKAGLPVGAVVGTKGIDAAAQLALVAGVANYGLGVIAEGNNGNADVVVTVLHHGVHQVVCRGLGVIQSGLPGSGVLVLVHPEVHAAGGVHDQDDVGLLGHGLALGALAARDVQGQRVGPVVITRDGLAVLRGGQVNGLGRARRRNPNAQCQRDGGGYAGSLGKEAPPSSPDVSYLARHGSSFIPRGINPTGVQLHRVYERKACFLNSIL